MLIVSPLVAQRIIFILGIVNAVTVLALFSSCRCFPGTKLGAILMTQVWYKRYYKYHCYLWWLLLASVAVHAFFGIALFGVPF